MNDDVGFAEDGKVTALFSLIVIVSPEIKAEEAKLDTVRVEEETEQVGPVAILLPDPVQDVAVVDTVNSEGKAMESVEEVERASPITKLKVIEAELEPTVAGLLVTESEERAPVPALYVAPEVMASMEYPLYEVYIWKESVGFVVLGCKIVANLRAIAVLPDV